MNSRYHGNQSTPLGTSSFMVEHTPGPAAARGKTNGNSSSKKVEKVPELMFPAKKNASPLHSSATPTGGSKQQLAPAHTVL